MSPEYVQPYVEAQKTDDRGAEAIAEAATRPTMRFVSLKSEDQLDLQILHAGLELGIHCRIGMAPDDAARRDKLVQRDRRVTGKSKEQNGCPQASH